MADTPRVARGGILRDADAFLDTALALTDLAHDEPEEAVQRIAGELRDLTGSRFCAFYTAERSELRPMVVVEHGAVLDEMVTRVCPLKNLPAARAVVREGKAQTFDDYGLPLCRVGFDDEGATSYTSGVLLPMVVGRKTVGVVEITDSVARDYESELVIVERLVKVATRAVIWSGDARRLTAREMVANELLELGDFIARAQNLTELVRPIAENLHKVVGAEDCDIWRASGDEFTCLASVDSTNGWDESVIGDTYSLADYPSYAAAVLSGSIRVVTSRNDPSLTDIELNSFERWGFNSNCCVPLMVGDATVGFIDIFDTRERDYAEHLEFLRNTARLLGGAFQKVALAEDNETSSRERQALIDTCRAVTSKASFEDRLAKLCHRAAEALDMPISIINEYVPEMNALVTRADFDRDQGENYDGTGTKVTLDEMPGDRLILESPEIVIEQLSDPELIAETRESMERWDEKTCINVPLHVAGEPVGIMMLLETAAERTFSERELALVSAIAELAALTIANARLERTLKQRSETDKLTGLANARHFRQRLADETGRARRHGLEISVCVIDIDDLRQLILGAGRQLANELLTTFADLIRARMHPAVDLAAHLGGGKFGLVLPCTPLEGEAMPASGAELDEDGEGPHPHGALGVAERLKGEIEGLTTMSGGGRLSQRVTASFGLAMLSPAMSGADDLLDAAEDALGRAKQAGKARIEIGE